MLYKQQIKLYYLTFLSAAFIQCFYMCLHPILSDGFVLLNPSNCWYSPTRCNSDYFVSDVNVPTADKTMSRIIAVGDKISFFITNFNLNWWI